MFGSIGGPELILIFLVALLIFGPRKLPELGRMLGKGLGEFRRAANDLRVSLETEVAREAPAQGGGVGATPAAAPGATPRQGGALMAAAPTATPASEASTASGVPDGDGPEGHPNPSTAPAATAPQAGAVASDARDADRTH